MSPPVIIILGKNALNLAQLVRENCGGEIHAPFEAADVIEFRDKPVTHIAEQFRQGHSIIGICASGILIRAVAAHLSDKVVEPAVVAVSPDGKFAVPLLGGHHGANELARAIATSLDGHAAVSTASDVMLDLDLENPPQGYALANPKLVKPAVRALLDGQKFNASDVPEFLAQHASSDGSIAVAVTCLNLASDVLTYHPKSLAIGVGCERGCSVEEVKALVDATLAAHNISRSAVACHASIDLKEDEPAINSLGIVRYFTVDELNSQAQFVANPSEAVRAEVGTPSVAEAAALAAAGPGGQLLVTKTKSRRATCAVAQAKKPIQPLLGRSRGSLHVVGLGPGGSETRSPQATHALRNADHWVGYDLYLKLAKEVQRGQVLHAFPLGDEERRVRHAIMLARQGNQVALICSGDAGIYAMAALAYEVLDAEPGRFELEIVPGISAFQAAAAKAGALIGHDFCCISLSDLLTPWPVIQNRVMAAATGDFVIAFYNPRSLKRRQQLEWAIERLRGHRPPATPVIIASNLGRPEEHMKIVKLSDFNPEDVDMLTVVLVGSTQSKMFQRSDNQTVAYTPRGYAAKRVAAE